MTCGIQEQLIVDIKYQREKGDTIVTETRIKNFFGIGSLALAEAEIASVVVGDVATFTAPITGYTFFKVVYSSCKVNMVNPLECYSEISVTGWGILDSQAPAKDLRITVGKCVPDKIIHKIPLGDTVVISLGEHYREVRLMGEAVTGTDADDRITAFCGTNPIIQAYVTYDILEGKFIYESMHIETCGN